MNNDDYMNKILDGWISYSSSKFDFKSRRAFIYIQDLVVYNIDSGHSDICIKMLNRLNDKDEDAQAIKEEYMNRLALINN